MTVEELFGTLQQSVVSAWRKHLKAYKYSDHMALDEFYDEMPEKVDDLIEAWMGVNGKKLKNYTNILNSSNMGTLKYLHELRRLVKQGYPLMNGEPELEAKLDDILELIDSTLYKIKELGGENTNESKYKMKDLKDFINESLCVNESHNISFVWDHYDPDTLYCVFGNASKIRKILSGTDYNFQDIKIKTKLCSVSWNDETLFAGEVKGNNLEDAKKIELKHIQSQLDNQKDQIENEGYVYIESDLFGSANEWEEGVKDMSAEDFLKGFLEMIQDSVVDGDSGYGRAVLDLQNKQVLLGNDGVEFINIDKLEEMLTQND